MAIQFVDGKILFVDGKIAMHADCCCEDDPCGDCSGTQPSATVTLDVDCGGDCEAAGVYTWDQFTSYGTDDCQWFWEKGDWFLTIYYSPAFLGGGGWGIQISNKIYNFLIEGVDGPACVAGTLTGEMLVQAGAGGDCDSCIATVTFG